MQLNNDTSCIITTILDVDEYSQITNIDVFPNPFEDIFNIKLSLQDAKDLSICITSIAGEIIYSDYLDQFSSEFYWEFNLDGYSKGVYFLEIKKYLVS